MDTVLCWSILLSVLIFQVRASFDSVYGTCCELGRQWQPQSRLCKPYPSPIHGIAEGDQNSCLAVIELCCLYSKNKKQCERGTQIAKVRRSCSGLHSQMGNEKLRECCNCCRIGAMAKKSGMVCSSLQVQFSAECKTVVTDCCNAQRRQALAAPATPAPPSFPGAIDECAQFPDQLCAHNCIDTVSSYKCSCRVGFTLQSDGRTCQQDEVLDLCTQNNPCQHLCTEDRRSIKCKCFEGYDLQADDRSCSDVDECLTSQHNCNEHQRCVNSAGSFTCEGPSGPDNDETVCDTGYSFNRYTDQCEDINECEINVRPCERNQECSNTIGSFTCRDQIPETTRRRDCPRGFLFNPRNSVCEDIDECSLGRDNCGADEQCINTGGSFYCRAKNAVVNSRGGHWTDDGVYRRDRGVASTDCDPGFAYNRILSRCEDVNECLTDSHSCSSPEQMCLNTAGSYRCQCADGYQMSRTDRSCQDINECATRVDACSTGQMCENTIGSYTCRRLAGCGTGYTLNSDTQQCVDDDECGLGTHNCGRTRECRNTLGSFRCIRKQCPSGYRLDYATGECQAVNCQRGMKPDDDGRCVDVNECLERRQVCRPNEECENTIGSYRCKNLVNCGAGFKLSRAGTVCEDIDECAENKHDCRGARMKCINREGSYICQCSTGFQMNTESGSCDDIDECRVHGGQMCSIEAMCENTMGSYRCNCKSGFRRSEDGNYCKDIDECEHIGMCQHECRNTWGSHQCLCQAGYKLAADDRTCNDIDECEIWKARGGRLCSGVCENTIGSYICTCPPGYRILTDGKTCQDIDECATRKANCYGEDMACINTRGSYKCESVKCPNGFVKASNPINPSRNSNFRCQRTTFVCAKGDTECLTAPVAYSTNFMTFPSKIRVPADLFTMRGPSSQYRRLEFSLKLVSATNPDTGAVEVDESYFQVTKRQPNVAVVQLLKEIDTAQDVKLQLDMNIYSHEYSSTKQETFLGTAVAVINVFVTEFRF